METNRHKDQWINEVMGSTEGMSRAQPRAGLYERVTAGITAPELTRTIAIPVKQWVAAAILLLALNIGSVLYFTAKGGKSQVSDNINPLAAEMQAGSTYNY